MPIDKAMILMQSAEAIVHYVNENRTEILGALEQTRDPDNLEIASDLWSALRVWNISSEDFLRSLEK